MKDQYSVSKKTFDVKDYQSLWHIRIEAAYDAKDIKEMLEREWCAEDAAEKITGLQSKQRNERNLRIHDLSNITLPVNRAHGQDDAKRTNELHTHHVSDGSV